MLAGLAVDALGVGRQLIVVAAIYGSRHLIRQHWGLSCADKARNDDRARLDDWVDTALFYTEMIGFRDTASGTRSPAPHPQTTETKRDSSRLVI